MEGGAEDGGNFDGVGGGRGERGGAERGKGGLF